MRRTLSPGTVIALAALTTAALAQTSQRPRPRPRPTPRAQATATASPTAAPTARPTAVPTKPRALAITHEEMGCVIIGKFPQFSACFDPGTDLAAADMFFTIPGKHTSWYRVPFKPEGKCHKATLPKPGKQLKDTSLSLYASGASRQFGEARTQEYSVKVVESEGQCKGEKPVAPYVASASVTVFPSLPIGFAAAAPGLPVLPIIGGATVLGGGAAVASGAFSEEPSDEGGGGPGGGGPSATPTPTSAPAAATPTPTPLPSANQAPVLDCKVSPDPPRGFFPLTVEFNLCRTEDPEGRPLNFSFDFGDGGRGGGFCRESHTYTSANNFTARLCVNDEVPANERCCTFNIRTEMPTPVPYKAFAERMAVTSTLEVPGGSGQVVMDDSQVAYPGEGTAYLLARARRGEIRFDAQLVTGKGQPGRWRFDLSQTEPMIPGTLRVIHGKVLQVKSDSVVFALQGKPGERVSFTFETWR